MIDVTKFDVTTMYYLGITFNDPDEADMTAQLFFNEVKQQTVNRLLTMLSDEQRMAYSKLEGEKEKEDWFKEHCRFYQVIREMVYVNIVWDLLANRENLAGAVIIPDDDLESVALSELDIPADERDFLAAHHIVTVRDAICSAALAAPAEEGSECVYSLRRRILDLLLSPQAHRSHNKLARAANMDEAFFVCENLQPEQTLAMLRQYILLQAEAFRSGEITEEDFYCNTYSQAAVQMLFSKKYHASFRSLCADEEQMRHCYREWKENGTVTPASWMYDLFVHDTTNDKAMEWLLEILDTLAVPLILCCDLRCFADCPKEKFRFPDVITRITDTTEEFMLAENCYDISRLLNDPSPVGKTYELHCVDGVKVSFTVQDAAQAFFKGEGVIDGYMAMKAPITVEIADARDGRETYFCFDKKTFTKMQILMRTTYHPIPHPAWNDYNTAVRTKSLRFEAEFKQLRLPFMMGTAE